MKVEALLRSKGNRIVAIGMATTVEGAARLLKTENIGAVVVKDSCGTEGDALLGILSERDIVRAIADRGARALRQQVGELMSRTLVSCAPLDETEDVVGLMHKHHVRHVPVLQGGALIGIISVRDLLGFAVGGGTSVAPPHRRSPDNAAPGDDP